MPEIELSEKKSRAALKLDGYKWKEEIVTYAGIKQTWLIVESATRKQSDLRQIESQLKKSKERADQLLKQLKTEKFDSPESARYQLKRIYIPERSFVFCRYFFCGNPRKSRDNVIFNVSVLVGLQPQSKATQKPIKSH